MNRDIAVAVGGAVVGIVIALAAYFVIQQVAPRGPCQGGAAEDHCIDVHVISVGGQPKIQDIGDEPVKKTGNIWWRLIDDTGTGAYAFNVTGNTGIDFTAPGNIPGTTTPKPVAPSTVFTGCGPAPDNHTIRCHDKYDPTNDPTSKGTFGYRVLVTGNGQNLELDPFIINN